MAVGQKISGIDGSLTMPTGYNACFDSWSLVLGQRQNNVSCFGDVFESNVGGLKFGRWTATGTPTFNNTSTAPISSTTPWITQTPANCVFTVATGCTFTIGVIVAEFAASSDVNGAARVAYSGPTSGAVAVVWDETA